MAKLLKNFAYSIVTVPPSPATSGTTLTVATGDGSIFPAVPFAATIWAPNTIALINNAEIVTVTDVTGDVLTITRAQESTVAKAVGIGWQIGATLTAAAWNALVTAVASVSSYKQVSGNYTVEEGDNYLFFTGNSNVVWAMPANTGTNSPKQIKHRGGNCTLTLTGTIFLDQPVSTLILGRGDMVTLSDDGTYWCVGN